MKTNFYKVAVLPAFVFITGFNVYKAQTEFQLSDSQMKNVEALAGGEWLPEFEIVCGAEGGKCWDTGDDCKIGCFHYAPDCVFTGSMDDYCLTPCEDD